MGAVCRLECKTYIWLRDCHRVINVLLCTKFHQNRMIYAARIAMPSCSVCPSICPSVTFVYFVDTNKYIFKKIAHMGSHTILVFPYQTL